jgi:hypothetical protein
MRKPAPKKPNVKTTPASPINFRMPPDLRARLRRFAKERNLAEAEALRLAAGAWKDAVARNQKKIEWQTWAQRKYRKLM